jgi:hypothetical protein
MLSIDVGRDRNRTLPWCVAPRIVLVNIGLTTALPAKTEELAIGNGRIKPRVARDRCLLVASSYAKTWILHEIGP